MSDEQRAILHNLHNLVHSNEQPATSKSLRGAECCEISQIHLKLETGIPNNTPSSTCSPLKLFRNTKELGLRTGTGAVEMELFLEWNPAFRSFRPGL